MQLSHISQLVGDTNSLNRLRYEGHQHQYKNNEKKNVKIGIHEEESIRDSLSLFFSLTLRSHGWGDCGGKSDKCRGWCCKIKLNRLSHFTTHSSIDNQSVIKHFEEIRHNHL